MGTVAKKKRMTIEQVTAQEEVGVTPSGRKYRIRYVGTPEQSREAEKKAADILLTPPSQG